MAVYTNFTKDNIEEILSNYSIGKLNSYEGIQEGIENTNYYLLVNNKKYTTIYQKEYLELSIHMHSTVYVFPCKC